MEYAILVMLSTVYNVTNTLPRIALNAHLATALKTIHVSIQVSALRPVPRVPQTNIANNVLQAIQ